MILTDHLGPFPWTVSAVETSVVGPVSSVLHLRSERRVRVSLDPSISVDVLNSIGWEWFSVNRWVGPFKEDGKVRRHCLWSPSGCIWFVDFIVTFPRLLIRR